MRGATVGAKKRPDRRRNGIDVRRMAVASVGEGGDVAGPVHQEQVRRRADHSKTRHHRGPLSTGVSVFFFSIFLNRF